jgi:hypothetical protein
MLRSIIHCISQCFCFQRIRSTIDEKDQKQLLMDLDVVMRSNECPYIVKFYGALFKEVLYWQVVAVMLGDLIVCKSLPFISFVMIMANLSQYLTAKWE